MNNRYRNRFPDEGRNIKNDLDLMTDIENEKRITVKHTKSNESGYTGLSISYQLSLLYRFDISKDLVVDVMHNLPLNVTRKLLDTLVTENCLPAEIVDEILQQIGWIAGKISMCNLCPFRRACDFLS